MIDIDTSREAVERLSADILRGNASTHRAAATLRALLAERDSFQRNMEAAAGLAARYGSERDKMAAMWDEAGVLIRAASACVRSSDECMLSAMKRAEQAERMHAQAFNACAAMRAERDAALRDLAAARKALRLVLPLAEAWADGKSRSHPDHECIDAARAALAAQPVTAGERA